MLLEVQNLNVQYSTSIGPVKAVTGMSFGVGENEVFGLIGESGCGKSTVIKTILRLLPKNATVPDGKIFFQGRNLLSISKSEIRTILGDDIALIPQSAMNSLNPVYRIGNQLIEAIQVHRNTQKKEARVMIKRLFELVGLESNLVESYPHEFSGGMKQRSIIAMALSLDPQLIIMDEPTTGLDVLVQYRILEKISEIQEQIGSSILLVTHDISVVAEMCDRIAVMYGGQLMELGNADEIFYDPHHPYTMGLLNAFPSLLSIDKELISIPGSPPSLIDRTPGCPFQQRCPFVASKCFDKIQMNEVATGHQSSCHYFERSGQFAKAARKKETWESSKQRT